MTKTQMIEYISKNYDWFQSMQLPLGHHSWWYTNRKPEDCIDVKIYAWVDVDKVKDKLSEKEKNATDTLGIDLNELCNDLVWGDWGMVEMARDSLSEELKEKYNVKDLEYGGRSGGWLAVVYQWDQIYDDFDSGEYTYTEVRAFYSTMRKAIVEHEQVIALVLERKKNLKNAIEDVENYIEQVQEFIGEKLDSSKIQAERVLAL